MRNESGFFGDVNRSGCEERERNNGYHRRKHTHTNMQTKGMEKERAK